MAEFGQTVEVHFTCTLADGTEIDNTYRRGQPFEYRLGAGTMIAGFERALSDLEPGERRSFHIPAVLAYGAYDESLIEVVPVQDIPNGNRLPVGQFVEFSTSTGTIRAKVQKIEGGQVYFDLNHELAGKDLDFDIELVSIKKEFESYAEEEKHPKGCACGCDQVREALREA